MSFKDYIWRLKCYYNYKRHFETKPTVSVIDFKIKENKYKKENKVWVSVVKVNNLKKDIKKSIDLIGGLKRSFKKTDSVLLIPNFNSDDLYPASTDLIFLKEVIKIFQEFGIKNITIGACSGIHWLPTRSTLEKLGVLKFAEKLNVKVVCFEERDWIKVKLKSDILKDLTFTNEAFKYDKLVYLPCLKSHRRARFSSAIKLTMGLLGIKDRIKYIHTDNLEEKLADINKAVYPDLIITDARKVFVNGGPDKGEVKDLNLVFASGDRTAIDIVGLGYLLKFKNKSSLLNKTNPEEYDQIKRAMKIGLGIKNKEEIEIVDDF